MNAELAKHLWRSSDVRGALKKEAFRLFVFVTVYIGTVACFRYIREMPIAEGVLSASIGMAAVVVAWLLSAIRALRAVLREHGHLGR